VRRMLVPARPPVNRIKKEERIAIWISWRVNRARDGVVESYVRKPQIVEHSTLCWPPASFSDATGVSAVEFAGW